MRRTARAVGLSFLVLLITLPWANAAQAPSLEVSRWSRPVAVIMTRIEARPALVVDRSGRIHLFYLDRDGDRGLVLWVTTDVDGRTSHPPRVLGVADLRANTLGAAGGDQAIQIMWVAPSGDGMRVVGARVAAGGAGPENPRMMPVPLGPQVEDAGPVSLVASRDGVHAVWSQARDGRREVWYRGPDRTPAALVGPGDAPAVSVGPSGPVVVWWQRTGFDTYRLVAARLGPAVSPVAITLTGNLASSRLQPPAAAHDAGGRLYVVFGTEQRGFGPAVARLSWLDVDAAGGASPRRSLAAGSPFASQVTALPWGERVAVAWTDLRSGRSRNPEIYTGVLRTGAAREERLTYTLSASRLPVLASGPVPLSGSGQPGGPGGAPVLTAAWLEVAPGGRFAMTLASTARPAARRFLLGIPELDLGRPGEAAPFALAALLGTLPYAGLLTLATGLLTAGVLMSARALFDETRWWGWIVASPRRSAVASTALTLAILRVVGGAVTFIPRAGLLPAAGVVAAVWGLARVRPRVAGSFGSRAGLVLVVAFAVSVAAAFVWAAGTLSQLAT